MLFTIIGVSIPYKRVTNRKVISNGKTQKCVSIPYKRVTNTGRTLPCYLITRFQSPISGSQTDLLILDADDGVMFQSPISGSQTEFFTRARFILSGFQSPISGSQTRYDPGNPLTHRCFNPL